MAQEMVVPSAPGTALEDLPEDLRIREFPAVTG